MVRGLRSILSSMLLVATCSAALSPSVLGQGMWASGEEDGDVLATPPKQSAAWRPQPTKLPTTLVSAAEDLFQLGLADPRGCEYREIEVLVGGHPPEWKDSVESTHGWVIPATRKPSAQFGVCWNGLVYRLRSIGKTADLRADALAAASAEPQLNAGITGWYWMGNNEGWYLCNPNEFRAVSYESPLPTKACLLLRLGEIELAEKLWNHWTDSFPKDTPLNNAATTNQPYLKDPYVTLANCWALALFDRARAAHLRGDDALALAAAEMLAKVGPAVKAEAERRGFSPSALADTSLSGDFSCGGILTDQRRRAKQRREKTAPPVRAGDYPDPAKFWEKFRRELDQCPDKAHRIAFLIHQFEEVSSLQDPGGVCIVGMSGFSGVLPSPECPSQHPISLFLASEGESAVEPLLACLQEDDRLTRWRPYVASQPVGVRVLAKGALEQTLRLPLPEIKGEATQPGLEEDGLEIEALAARARAYWQRYKSVPPMERWYAVLADDHARDRWLVAARTIVQPASVPVTLDSVQFGYREDIIPYNPAGQEMHGEPLRKKTGPSVTELMVGRVEALDEPINQLLASRRRLDQREKQLSERAAELERQQSSMNHELEKLDEQHVQLCEQRDELDEQEEELWRRYAGEGCGSDMALCLAKWDPVAAIPVLRRLTASADRFQATRDTQFPSLVAMNPVKESDLDFAELLIVRIDIGDATALDQYASWIRGVKPGDVVGFPQPVAGVGYRLRRLLAPLWQHPDHPAVAATTEWLFNGKESPWNPVVTPPETAENRISVEPLRGPLITLPAFREQLARLLEDRREAGQVEVVSNEEIRTGVESWEAPTGSTVPGNPLCPAPGTKAAFRICDVYAYGLSSLDGAPKCELFWPEKQRDRAVRACRDFLQQYGRHFRLVPQRYPFGDRGHVELVFPILDHPATPEDVRRGDAVFSLAGQGTVRVCEVPRLPSAARWTTQTDYPVLKDEWDEAAGKYKKIIGYERDGIVWQAEELQSGGRWHRFYGMVGRYGLAKIPAEEIDFPWRHIDAGLPTDAAVMDSIPLDDAFDIGWTAPGPGTVFTIGAPLVCRMLVRNHSAVERTLPPLAASSDHAKPASDAVTIDTGLCWTHPLTYWSGEESKVPPWTRLVPRKPERLVFNQLQRPLGPGEQFEVLRYDLNEQFGPLRAGLYGFSTKLVGNGEPRSQGEPDVFFELVQGEPEPSPSETPR